MLKCKMDDQLSTSWILDDSQCLFTHFDGLEDEQNIRYLLQNAKLLEKLHISVEFSSQSLVGLLSPSARTLKVLNLSVSFHRHFVHLPLAGLCEELEAIAGHNMPEALSFRIHVHCHETEDCIGSIIQGVEKVLVKPGWSALRTVSFKVSTPTWKASEALQSTRLISRSPFKTRVCCFQPFSLQQGLTKNNFLSSLVSIMIT